MRARVRVVLVASLLAAPAGCRKPPHEQAPAELVSADARIWIRDGDKSAPVPEGDLGHAGPRVPVVREPAGKRLAYPVSGGGSRIVYVVGDALFVGPKAPDVLGGGRVDFSAAPILDDALGAIFENAVGRRSTAVAAVRKERGDGGVARMLAASAHVDDRAWEEAFDSLPDGARADVRKQLATALDRGRPPAGLRRAVRFAVFDPSRADALVARVRELLDPIREPRAAAVLLRFVANTNANAGADVACEVLRQKPTDPASARAAADDLDLPGRAVLAEAAALVLARAGAECDALEPLLEGERCAAFFRCAGGKPLTGREETKQDEPLCTPAELADVVARELARTPDDVMAAATGTRAELFAYAALAAKGRVPKAFAAAHARRRYALSQPKDPTCEAGAPPGTPCRCDEATIRDQACRRAESDVVSVGVCRFEIDDKQKKLFNVVATLPP